MFVKNIDSADIAMEENRILGSLHWITDPDLDQYPDLDPYPDIALFVCGFQDVNNKYFFLLFFAYFIAVGTVHLHQSSKKTSH
jgi:hypothetical protein